MVSTWTSGATYILTAVAGFEITGNAGILISAPSVSIVAAKEVEKDGATTTQLIGTKNSFTGVGIEFQGISISMRGTAIGLAGATFDFTGAQADVGGISVGFEAFKKKD